MSIQEISGKFKGLVANDEWFTTALVILVAVVAFGLGRASVMQAGARVSASVSSAVSTPPPIVETAAVVDANSTGTPANPPIPAIAPATSGAYVASKNGAKYHLPTCPGAKQIKDKNKVWFQTKAEAEAAGYTPAANCKGI